MEVLATPSASPHAAVDTPATRPVSAVSWGAIFAGSVVAASVSLVLFAIGSGLGLAAVSPWQAVGVTAATSTVLAAVWLIVMQWVAAGVGGFITGRLRVRWIGTHEHEVFFRDTAHGFVTWALSTVLVAALALSGASAVLSAGGRAVGAAASGAGAMAAKSAEGTSPVSPYGLDTLFRSDRPDTANTGDARSESSRIVLNAISTGTLPDADRDYLSSLVAARTGISKDDAQKRVDALVADAKAADAKVRAAADAARKAASKGSLLAALSLLIGAFIACVAAAIGGHHRDMHP